MELRFLGAATTVTGSQFLLTTKRAKVLVDCGMFQGNPHETQHNRMPPDYDPAQIDAVLLTHAHLDHCGLIPLVAKRGLVAPIFATAGTVELAGLVLLDSGKLQEEFAQRDERRKTRRAQGGAAEDAEAAAQHPLQHAPPPHNLDPERAVLAQLPAANDTAAPQIYTIADAER